MAHGQLTTFLTLNLTPSGHRQPGLLISFPGVRDPDSNSSHLAVIWYQDAYAIPIAPVALAAIRSLDRENLAADARCEMRFRAARYSFWGTTGREGRPDSDAGDS